MIFQKEELCKSCSYFATRDSGQFRNKSKNSESQSISRVQVEVMMSVGMITGGSKIGASIELSQQSITLYHV